MTQIKMPPALASLASQPRWMCWKWKMGKSGKRTKPPYRADAPSEYASSTDPATWCELEVCLQAYDQGQVDGIGYALKDGNIGAIDIDDCRKKETGELHPWAAALVERAHTYCEVTPSQEGIRIIGTCAEAAVHRKFNVADGVSCELYRVADRYITISGQQIGDASELGNIDGLIDELLVELESAKQAKRKTKNGSASTHGSNKHDLNSLIKDGCGEHFGGDRSRAVWYVIHQLLERGDSVEDIVKVITDPNNSIAAHCLSKPGDYRAYARKQVEKARLERAEEQAKKKVAGGTEEDAEIARLAKLSAFDYEHERKDVADGLGVRAAILDKLVAAKRAELQPTGDRYLQGTAVTFPQTEPWPEPVAGDQLLDDVATAIRKHVVLAEQERDLAALWIIHTYLLDAFLITPRLAVRSPTRRCGKTTLLDVLGRLVHRPLPAANTSASAVFRVIEMYRPCLLVDEADTFLRDNDELRGVLNAGHRRGGSVLRTVGDDHEPRAFSVYGAATIALIGALPGTLDDRSVSITLKRRKADEPITPFRIDRTEHLDTLARRIARWAHDNADAVREADPEMPEGVFNREADNLRPLLAISDVAGGEWPQRAREAAGASREGGEADEGSRLELLLGDLRGIWNALGKDSIWSAALVKELIAIEGRPWAEFGRSKKQITQNGLARLLKPLGIVPHAIRTGDDVARGYTRQQFEEAFSRFLPPEGGSEPLQRYNADEMGSSGISKPLQAENGVTDQKNEKPNNDGESNGVTDGEGGNGATTLDRAALDLLARRFNAMGYDDSKSNEIEALREAEADLRRELVGLLPSDRVESEYRRVWWRALDLRNGATL